MATIKKAIQNSFFLAQESELRDFLDASKSTVLHFSPGKFELCWNESKSTNSKMNSPELRFDELQKIRQDLHHDWYNYFYNSAKSAPARHGLPHPQAPAAAHLLPVAIVSPLLGCRTNNVPFFTYKIFLRFTHFVPYTSSLRQWPLSTYPFNIMCATVFTLLQLVDIWAVSRFAYYK